MSPADYRSLRKGVGTQEAVAKRLGLSRVTVFRRETGLLPITAEAEYSLRWLAQKGSLAPSRPGNEPSRSEAERPAVRKASKKVRFDGVARNAFCPCGSGKKFKRCHGH